jgi:hypothetical protein
MGVPVTRRRFREYAFPVFDPLFALLRQGGGLRDETLSIVVEGHLARQEHVQPADRDFRCFSGFVKACQGAAFPVHGFDRRKQPFEGEAVAGDFLQLFHEVRHGSPEKGKTGLPFRVGKVHHVGGGHIAQHFPGFFLPIAGIFSHHEIDGLEVGAGP